MRLFELVIGGRAVVYLLRVIAAVLLLPAVRSAAQPPAAPAPGRLALTGATLIDGTGSAPIPDAVVLVDGDRITAIGRRAAVRLPTGIPVIDVSGKWILPGFVDLHMHLTYPNIQNDSEATLRAVYFMDMFLRKGITTVRDVAAPIQPMQAIMAATRQGALNSIRVFGVGQLITTTGGHGSGRSALQVDGPWEFRRAVRTIFDAGFRHIKLSPTYTPEEVAAAVEEARTLGMRITSHGGGRSDTWPKTTMTRIAVLGGVQCIEHLNPMEDDVLDLIAERGVHVVPTLTVYRQMYQEGLMARLGRDLLERGWTQAVHETLFKKALARQIVMGIGTDGVGGMMRHYPDLYFTEMKYFVELGMTPMQAIVTATKNGGLILGLPNLGTLEPGKLADLQVVAANPLESFHVLGKPELVLVGGRVHRFQ